MGGEVNLRLVRPEGKTETIAVKIPAGIEDGKTIRLRGQGEPSTNGGPAGDLLITVRSQPHANYRRDGLDLIARVPVTVAEAALGREGRCADATWHDLAEGAVGHVERHAVAGQGTRHEERATGGRAICMRRSRSWFPSRSMNQRGAGSAARCAVEAAESAGGIGMVSITILAKQAAPLIKRLDDPTRAKVLATLAGLIILGFAMVLLAWLAARFTQRYRWGTSYFRPTPRPREHDWTKKPLTPGESKPPTPDS